MKNKLTLIHEKLRGVFRGLIYLILPSVIVNFLLRLFGCSNTIKIGFSFVYSDSSWKNLNIKIGHFNFIKVKNIHFRGQNNIGNFNFIKGNFSIVLDEKSQIGNRNIITRAKKGVSYGDSTLTIGSNSKITASHRLDLMRPINIGHNSILAGVNSQIWTHGYTHNIDGKRFRIDGSVVIGNNVYVGSSVIINAGIKISDNVTVGSGSVVSKNLEEHGLYVSQKLRYIERFNKSEPSLTEIKNNSLVERVFTKDI